MWTNALGAIKFLPLGKGAIILMLGGFLMLMVTLFWSLIMPRPQPAGVSARHNRHAAVPRGRRIQAASQRQVVVDRPGAWPAAADAAAHEQGLGAVERIGQVPGGTRIRLTACRSCRDGRRCQPEADLLAEAIAEAGTVVTVIERACRAVGDGECVFEVRTGADA